MRRLLLALLPLALITAPVKAQRVDNIPAVVSITNTARVPGTVTQNAPANTGGQGVYCVFSQSAEAGTPSTVISVEAEDTVGQTWQSLASSSAFAGLTGSVSVLIYPGAVSTSVPSGLVVSGLRLPVIWRLKQVITGGTTSTGDATCDLLN